MKKIVLLFLFCFSLVFAETGVVVDIVDSDTIKVKDSTGVVSKLRIYGIDGPESYMSTKMAWDSYHCDASTKVIQALGKQATAQLKTLIKVGDVIAYEFKGREEFGRDLAYIPSLSTKMLESGFVYVSKYSLTETEFTNISSKSKSEGKGLWNDKVFNCLSNKN